MAKTPSTETAVTEAPVAKLRALFRSAVTYQDARNNTWSVVVPRGTTKEMLLLSIIWSVVADQFKANDRVYVIEESRSFYAELLVLDAGRGYCNMHLLSFHPLPALLVSEAGLPPGFECFFAGPITNDEGGYCVRRLADGVLMVKAKASREAALAELLESATLR